MSQSPIRCIRVNHFNVVVDGFETSLLAPKQFLLNARYGPHYVGLEFEVPEVMTPSGPGAAERHLRRYGDGIRSVVFSVAGLARARDYLAGQGLPVHPGDADGAIAPAPEDTCGVLFEFAE